MNVAITILLIADAVVTLWLLFVTVPDGRQRAYADGLARGTLEGRGRQLRAVADELSVETLRHQIDKLNQDGGWMLSEQHKAESVLYRRLGL